MTDAIDRQEVIGYIDRVRTTGMGKKQSLKYIRLYIEKMPSVQPEPQTCCGYDVNKLIVFATACRQQGVENGDLKAFANNCIFAWNVMSGEIAKTIEDIMRGQSDD